MSDTASQTYVVHIRLRVPETKNGRPTAPEDVNDFLTALIINKGVEIEAIDSERVKDE